jgi:8-oxo-dGTP diphosphatase
MVDAHWQPPHVLLAVDLVILTIRQFRLCVLLIERGIEPCQGMLALPGGFLYDEHEPIEAAAHRELSEETGLDASSLHLELLSVYGDPGRDPRGRVVSVAHLAIAPRLPVPAPGTDAADARWRPVEEVLAPGVRLAFDHNRILTDGLERARATLEHTTVAAAFCPETFTLGELQEVYEAVWGVRLDPRNFYRKVQAAHGFVEAAGPHRKSSTGRPARLFRRGPGTRLHPPMLRPTRPGEETP